jgi:hypothetical protein
MSMSQLTPKIALLTYRAIARWNNENIAGSILCATLYINRDSAWKGAFHQQTPDHRVSGR